MRQLPILAASLFLLMAGCKPRDLTIPAQPQRGKVLGVVDTRGHISPAGLTVVLVSDEGVRSTQTTDAAGAFLFGDLLPGTYYLELTPPGFAPLVRPGLRVRGGSALDAGTLQPTWLQGTPQEAVVSGKVVVSGGSSPQGGQVEFLLQPLGERVALAPIGLGGEFVQRVPPGRYRLRAVHPLFVTATLDDMLVGEGERRDLTATPLAMDLNPATVSGTVLRERDGLPAVAAAGVLVTLGNGATTTTDTNGTFQLGGLAGGPQTLRLTLAGHHDTVASHPFTLTPGEVTPLPPTTLRLDRGALSGTVVLGDGQPARDVTVAVTGTGYAAVAVPDTAEPWRARFLLPRVPVGTYEVVATKAGYARATAASVAVTADATTAVSTLTLPLLRGAFGIDDGDPASPPGFTRSREVVLDLSGLPGAVAFRASEDPAFPGVGFSPLTEPQQPFVLDAGAPEAREGTHTVYVQYRDETGQESPAVSASVVLDRTPPAAASVLLSEGAAFTRTANPLVLTLEAQEPVPSGADTVAGLAQVLLSESPTVDAQGRLTAVAQPYQRTVTFARASSADGPQDVYAQFLDHAGNASAVVHARIVVDTAAPTGSLAIARGPRATADGYTDTALVELSVGAAPEPHGGYVLLKLANSQGALTNAVLQPLQATSSWFLDASAEGMKTVWAVLQDAAGNTSAPLQATITYDATPPSPATAALLEPSPTRASTVTLSLTAADDSGLSDTQAVTASEDPLFTGTTTVGPVPFPSSGQLPFPLSAQDGPKQVYVRFRDRAGNAALASVGLTRDTEPPSGTFTLQGALADGTPSTQYTATPSVTLSITQSGATRSLLGDATLSTCPAEGYSALTSSTLAHTLPGPNGQHAVRLCLRDDAGNTLGPLEQRITLDTAAPGACALTLVGARADGSAGPAERTATPWVRADVAGCAETPAEMVLTSGAVACSAGAALAWVPFQPSSYVTLPGPDGANTVRGCVRDLAGNVAAVTADSVELDTTPPLAPGVRIDSGASYVNAAQVAARGGYLASVEGSATGATEWAVSSQSSTPSAFTDLATSTPTLLAFAGEGTQSAWAVFRDDVGNTSAVASDSIVFDTQAPPLDGTSVQLNPGSNGYTNTVSVLAQVQGASGAHRMLVGMAANAAACVDTDVDAAEPERFTALPFSLLLPSGDGLKRVCLKLVDEAGNVSGFIPSGGTLTLDTVPPTAPAILNGNQVLNRPDGTPYEVATGGPVSDLHFARYEVMGGKTSHWTTTSTDANTTSFRFNLVSRSDDEDGFPNVLRVRAVDLAGNTAESSVVITTDIVAPQRVTLDPLWVTNLDAAGVLHWSASTSPDVVGYRVHYGSASGIYNGQNASQGPSPITVGRSPRATLSGLVNGSPVHVTVTAVDHAGNESPRPLGPAEAVLQPNTLSLDQIATIGLAMQRVARLARDESTLYVLGSTGDCSTGASTVLQTLELSGLVSPLQGGSPRTPAPVPPVPTSPLTYADALSCRQARLMDVQVDGNHLFLASGSKLRIFRLSTPAPPTLLTALDFGAGFEAQSLQVKGPTLFLSGVESVSGSDKVALYAVDLDSLFDGDPTTVPTLPASQLGKVGNVPYSGNPMGGLAWSRDRLVHLEATTSTWRIPDALDRSAATVWDGTDQQLPVTGDAVYPYPSSNPAVGGNLMYVNGYTGFFVSPLNKVWGSEAFSDQVPLSTFSLKGGYQFEVLGTQSFVSDSATYGIRALDLTDVRAPRLVGHVRQAGASRLITPVITYGSYVLAGSDSGLLVFEAAMPRSMRQVARATAGRTAHTLVGGLLYSGGSVVDLQAGAQPEVLGRLTLCHYTSAFIDDSEVYAAGPELRVVNLEDAADRDPATTFDTSDTYAVPFSPAGPHATGIAAYGHHLVVVQTRADGTYLEVFNARKLRDRQGGTLSQADSLGTAGTFRVTSSVGRAEVSIARGRAFVSLDAASGAGVYIVDLTPLFDDDSATGLTASSLQGYVAPPGTSTSVRKAEVQGNFLYLPASQGLSVVDVSAALDGDPATTVPASPTRGLLGLPFAQAVSVHGSYAVVLQGSSVAALDVSSPLQPALLSTLPLQRTSATCGLAGEWVDIRPSISVHGSRAYLSEAGGITVLELE